MDKETYISSFIAAYVSCVRASTGLSPEITAADYIQLRRQALLEYVPKSDGVPKINSSRTIIQEKAVEVENDLHRNITAEQITERIPQAVKPDEDAELAILRSLGEED